MGKQPNKPRKGLRSWRPTLEVLEERALLYGGNGLEFNITNVGTVPQQVRDAFQAAANISIAAASAPAAARPPMPPVMPPISAWFCWLFRAWTLIA